MIHLIGIGKDKGNITLNAFKAIKGADIIVNYDNVDLSFFDSEIENKEIYSAYELNNYLDLDLDFKDSNLEKELNNNSQSYKLSLLEKIQQENDVIEFAISKSLEGKEILLVSSDEPNLIGLSNRFLQIKSKYSNVEYKIYPGVSKINHSAAIVGAPFGDFAVIDLSNPLSPLSDIETKIRNILEANLVLVVKNPINDHGKEYFNKLKEIVNEFNPNLFTAIVNKEEHNLINMFKFIDDDDINKDSLLIIGNKFSYILEDKLVSSSDYIADTELMSYNIEFFEKYLKDESPKGIDYDCEYLPCHKELESCDFCYCPFYPCADGLTGGEWIKDRDIWSCQDCVWIHLEEPCKAIREGLEDIFEEIDDLKDKHIELLKLRRECLIKTYKN